MKIRVSFMGSVLAKAKNIESFQKQSLAMKWCGVVKLRNGNGTCKIEASISFKQQF